MTSLLLAILIITGSVIGLAILAVLSDMITLKTSAAIKGLYSALLICLLLLVSVLAIKLLSESDKTWRPSFKSSDSCDKKNPPFWCDMQAGE